MFRTENLGIHFKRFDLTIRNISEVRVCALFKNDGLVVKTQVLIIELAK